MRASIAEIRVLVACEYSGIVRDAFLNRGFDAWSCDLLPAETNSNRHIRGDVREILSDGWDFLMVAHPPCTRLCNSGARWLTEPPKRLNPEHYSPEECAAYQLMDRAARLVFMWDSLRKGARLFSDCWNASVPRVAIENPVMHRHAKERIECYMPPAQTVQPWWFGEPQFKATGLYLRGLPNLQPTKMLTPPPKGSEEHKKWSRVHRMRPGPERSKERSRFFPGIAAAMASQWGDVLIAELVSREAAA